MSAVEPVIEGRVMVPVENMAELDTLDGHAREVALTGMLEQARAWLAHAREASAPAREIADFRAFVASAADAARRVEVSKEIQLDADEMVRRSERALGVAVRAGQEAGEIRVQGQRQGPRGTYTRFRHGREELVQAVNAESSNCLPSPYDYARPHEYRTGAGIYDLTDGVSEAEFESALATAKAEGNLTRASLVRHVQNVKSEAPDAIERMRDMAASGHTSRQIATAIGTDVEGVTYRAKKHGIDIPADRVVGRTLRIDSNRIIRETVATLEGVAMGIEMVDVNDLDQSEIQNWTDSLTASIRALNRLNKQMKEKVQ